MLENALLRVEFTGLALEHRDGLWAALHVEEPAAVGREEVRERVDAVGEGHACPEAQRRGLSATGDRSGWQSDGGSRQFLLPVAASTFGHQASFSLVLSVTALPSALNT